MTNTIQKTRSNPSFGLATCHGIRVNPKEEVSRLFTLTDDVIARNFSFKETKMNGNLKQDVFARLDNKDVLAVTKNGNSVVAVDFTPEGKEAYHIEKDEEGFQPKMMDILGQALDMFKRLASGQK